MQAFFGYGYHPSISGSPFVACVKLHPAVASLKARWQHGANTAGSLRAQRYDWIHTRCATRGDVNGKQGYGEQ
jgi:hypothetical protein